MSKRPVIRGLLHLGGPLALVPLLALLLFGAVSCAGLGLGTPSPTSQGIKVIVVTATPRATATAEPQTPTPAATPSPEVVPTLVPTVAPTPTAEPSRPSPTVTPEASATATSARTSNLMVAEPVAGQLVSSPIRVMGMARAFEATIEVAVTVDGKQIAHSGVHTSAGAPEWGMFDSAIEADVTAGTAPVNAEVRVMIPSMKDDSYSEVVTIPVRIQPGAAQSATPGTRVVKVYFEKTVGDQLTFVPVNRTIPWTLAVGRASLDELLKGPTAAENAAGLQTRLPDGTKVRGLQIKNGVAYADFDRTLEKGAQGSTATYGLIQQVRLTLLQFSTVKQVVISVEGKTEGILAP